MNASQLIVARDDLKQSMLDRCITVTESRGQAAVEQVYLDTLNGRVPPDQDHILSLAE
jgi:hypothetical protein